MLYGSGVFVCVHFQELSMYIWMCRGQVCDYFMGLVDVVYVGTLCLYDSVFCKMAELILCERLGMWGYVYASSVVLYVYLEQRAYRMILLHICSVLGNCGCIWDLWRVMC